jgi:hypothetical protein
VKVIEYTKTLILKINEDIKTIDSENDELVIKGKLTVQYLIEQLNSLKEKVRAHKFSSFHVIKELIYRY